MPKIPLNQRLILVKMKKDVGFILATYPTFRLLIAPVKDKQRSQPTPRILYYFSHTNNVKYIINLRERFVAVIFLTLFKVAKFECRRRRSLNVLFD